MSNSVYKYLLKSLPFILLLTHSSAELKAGSLSENPDVVFDIPHEVYGKKIQPTNKLPKWLHSGTFIRNTAVGFEVKGVRNDHLFDGLSMLHAFTFKNGKIFYSNKYLRSDAFRAVESGTMNYSGFASDPCRSVFKNFLSYFIEDSSTTLENANVNVTKIFDSYVALTETPLPVKFDPKTLKTVGVLDYQDHLPKKNCWESAHPHTDADRQAVLSYLVEYGCNSKYVLYHLNKETLAREVFAEIPVSEPAYMHSFALTENYIVLTEFPFVVKPLDILLSSEPFIKNFKWKPENGTRFTVIDRKSGDVVSQYKTRPFFAFHHANAFEKNGLIHIDIATYNDASVITLFTNEHRDTMKQKVLLERFTIDQNNDTLSSKVLFSKAPIEFPRVNEDYDGKQYSHVYAVGFPGITDKADKQAYGSNALYKINTDTEEFLKWSEDGCSPSEPVFVKSPTGVDEDDGVVLSVVINDEKNTSFLLVLNAKDFTEIARAETPYKISAVGLHGQYFKGNFR